MSDNFLLTRGDHQSSLAGSIKEETEFQDVILACEDQQVRAHKVVLAAGSPKLRSILLSNPHPQPLIYMSGVTFSVLENIVKFIYHGEVDISSDQLDSFLDVAQNLQVKGLMGPVGGGQTGTEASNTSSKEEGERENTRNYQEVVEVEEIEVEDNNSNIASASHFYGYDALSAVEEEDMNTVDIAEDEGQEGDTAMGGGSINYPCPYCPKGFHFRSKFEEHVRSHTKEKPFSCEFCTKSYSQSYVLARHIRAKH